MWQYMWQTIHVAVRVADSTCCSRGKHAAPVEVSIRSFSLGEEILGESEGFAPPLACKGVDRNRLGQINLLQIYNIY
jgi:hypothetical protein